MPEHAVCKSRKITKISSAVVSGHFMDLNRFLISSLHFKDEPVCSCPTMAKHDKDTEVVVESRLTFVHEILCRTYNGKETEVALLA